MKIPLFLIEISLLLYRIPPFLGGKRERFMKKIRFLRKKSRKKFQKFWKTHEFLKKYPLFSENSTFSLLFSTFSQRISTFSCEKMSNFFQMTEIFLKKSKKYQNTFSKIIDFSKKCSTKLKNGCSKSSRNIQGVSQKSQKHILTSVP